MATPINFGITYAVITPQSLSSFQMSFLGDRFVIIYLNICPSSPSKDPKLSGSWGRSYWLTRVQIEHKHQFSSVTQSCPTLCDPMDCSTPGFLVQHQLLELTQTHVHQVSDAIQQSHPVSPFSFCLQSFPALGCFLVSQFFASRDQSIGVSASTLVLPMNIQDWSPLGT